MQVIYPVALDGPILTIRRFPEHAITMEDLIAKESITREAATFLEQMVKAGALKENKKVAVDILEEVH